MVNLVKVDQQCNKLNDSPYPVNPAGCFVIHSAVHAAREDAGCVLHTHTRAGVAVSARARRAADTSVHLRAGLAWLSRLRGRRLARREKPRLQADLGAANFLMLRNHGLLTVGTHRGRLPGDVHIREHLPDPDRGAGGGGD